MTGAIESLKAEIAKLTKERDEAQRILKSPPDEAQVILRKIRAQNWGNGGVHIMDIDEAEAELIAFAAPYIARAETAEATLARLTTPGEEAREVARKIAHRATACELNESIWAKDNNMQHDLSCTILTNKIIAALTAYAAIYIARAERAERRAARLESELQRRLVPGCECERCKKSRAALEADEDVGPPRVRCSECDNGVSNDWTYCPYCGAQGRTEKA